MMFGIAIRNETVGALTQLHSLHSPFFFLDEDVLLLGVVLRGALAETYVNKLQILDVVLRLKLSC